MNLTETQYERIARRIDGEAVELDSAELAVMDGILADEGAIAPLLRAPQSAADAGMSLAAEYIELGRQERALGELLDVEVPEAAMDRAWRRTQAALARPQRRMFRLAGAAGALAAAAAAVLIFTLAARQDLAPTPQPHKQFVAHPAEPGAVVAVADSYAASIQAGQDPAISLLAAEIDQLEADVLVAGSPSPVDMNLDQTQQAVEDFWLDDIVE